MALKIVRILFIIVLYFLSFSTNACLAPAYGYKWSGEDLAKHSKNIVLAKVIRRNPNDVFAIYDVEIIETIREITKFDNQDGLVFYYFNDDHSDTTFNDHNDIKFWTEHKGRTQCEGECFCGVHHVFQNDFVYLLFLDNLGAFKSAEIINDIKNDKWLNYVKKTKYIKK